jgi:hypothetical protein
MPVRINIDETSQSLSARGGLVLWREALDQLALEKKLASSLPTYKIATAASSYEKFEAIVLGLAAGGDCLDEMDRLATDPGFDAVTGELVTARSYGDYLRMFDPQLLKNLKYVLIDNAIELSSIQTEVSASTYIGCQTLARRRRPASAAGAFPPMRIKRSAAAICTRVSRPLCIRAVFSLMPVASRALAGR